MRADTGLLLSSLSTFKNSVIYKVIFKFVSTFVRGADSLGGFGYNSKRFVLGKAQREKCKPEVKSREFVA
jgi:hypothetical protein